MEGWGNLRGMRRLSDFGLGKLARVATTPTHYCGVDLEDFLARPEKLYQVPRPLSMAD